MKRFSELGALAASSGHASPSLEGATGGLILRPGPGAEGAQGLFAVDPLAEE